MNVSAKVDVVMADTTPAAAPLHADATEAADQAEVSPDAHRRIIILAPTVRSGYMEARALGIKPAAVVTPRSIDAARGITADEIIEAPGLTPEVRDELMAEAAPALATTREAGI